MVSGRKTRNRVTGPITRLSDHSRAAAEQAALVRHVASGLRRVCLPSWAEETERLGSEPGTDSLSVKWKRHQLGVGAVSVGQGRSIASRCAWNSLALSQC